jgi:hypothetical protein
VRVYRKNFKRGERRRGERTLIKGSGTEKRKLKTMEMKGSAEGKGMYESAQRRLGATRLNRMEWKQRGSK